jgi:hypothetical protein
LQGRVCLSKDAAGKKRQWKQSDLNKSITGRFATLFLTFGLIGPANIMLAISK